MKVSQLLFLAFFAIVGSAIAQDEEQERNNPCDAVCASWLEEVRGQASREKDELHGNIRAANERHDAANERLEATNEQVIARNNEIDQLRGEIGGFRQLLGDVEAAVEDGKRALEDARNEGAKALDAESKKVAAESEKVAAAEKAFDAEHKKVAAAEATLAIMQMELDNAKDEAEEYSNSRFLINLKLIQKDIRDFFQKIGIMKAKDDSADL
jgi:chromosome segregation ATPase